MDRESRISSYAPNSCQPLTPDSPLNPTILPHVKEHITPLPITPPSPCSEPSESLRTSAASSALLTGLHVLAAERDALMHLHHHYATSQFAQQSFSDSVEIISSTISRGGKLVVSGVGKSGKIGQKFIATCNSMQITSIWLHPTEALHGDLGVMGPNDTLLLLTFSSNTPELHALLPHISSRPLIAITAHPSPTSCPLFSLYPRTAPNILLPAPIPIAESLVFGVSAPTTSTTVALAVCDALALAVAGNLHDRPDEVFRKFHPGGAIGATSRVQQAEAAEVDMMRNDVNDLCLGEVDSGLGSPRPDDL